MKKRWRVPSTCSCNPGGARDRGAVTSLIFVQAHNNLQHLPDAGESTILLADVFRPRWCADRARPLWA
jgi:hypothetical protein